jgi:ATP-dependent helicase/nuclease subunit A
VTEPTLPTPDATPDPAEPGSAPTPTSPTAPTFVPGAASTGGASAPPDQGARDLVSRTGLERTLFVEAGAGTGKTTQLVERISNLVLDHGVRLVHIAAITFTEAAAAELQARIRQRFEEHAAATEPGTDLHQRCLDALADADLAAISTLHGFASRLLGEFAVAAGLPPRVQVLDEVSSQLAHEERWERFLDGLYSDPAREDALIRAACVDAALEPRYAGHSTLKDVAAELNDNWDRLTTLAATPPAAIGPVDFTAFDRAVAAVAACPPGAAIPTISSVGTSPAPCCPR